MQIQGIPAIRKELDHISHADLKEICLRLARFKKDNKELLSYLLFDAHDEADYVERVKEDMDDQFEEINRLNYYYIKKSVRKILRNLKKYARYSGVKETEVKLLMHFLVRLKELSPRYTGNPVLVGIYDRHYDLLVKAISALHEDLQFDYRDDLETKAL